MSETTTTANRAAQTLAETIPLQIERVNYLISEAKSEGKVSAHARGLGRLLDEVIKQLLEDGFDVEVITHPLNGDTTIISWDKAKTGQRGMFKES